MPVEKNRTKQNNGTEQKQHKKLYDDLKPIAKNMKPTLWVQCENPFLASSLTAMNILRLIAKVLQPQVFVI